MPTAYTRGTTMRGVIKKAALGLAAVLIPLTPASEAQASTMATGSIVLHCDTPFGGGTINSYPAAESGGTVTCPTIAIALDGVDSDGDSFTIDETADASGTITVRASCSPPGPPAWVTVEGNLSVGGLTATRPSFATTEAASLSIGYLLEFAVAAAPYNPVLGTLTSLGVSFAGGATAASPVLPGGGSGLFNFKSPPSWCSPVPTSIDYGFEVAFGQPDQAVPPGGEPLPLPPLNWFFGFVPGLPDPNALNAYLSSDEYQNGGPEPPDRVDLQFSGGQEVSRQRFEPWIDGEADTLARLVGIDSDGNETCSGLSANVHADTRLDVMRAIGTETVDEDEADGGCGTSVYARAFGSRPYPLYQGTLWTSYHRGEATDVVWTSPNGHTVPYGPIRADRACRVFFLDILVEEIELGCAPIGNVGD